MVVVVQNCVSWRDCEFCVVCVVVVVVWGVCCLILPLSRSGVFGDLVGQQGFRARQATFGYSQKV
ncbi:hypothetical protein E2C01_041661 [Portunus trituberculatus]|uniref:Uncharacterized protein n=1 Tax=Portunus trituberculatus TaxID=210409 RepID=A0A5B7FJU4_PORTR|nr:hypothetical protein [Portunus trituberculatus]